jgi:SET domain-containing protein
VPKLPDLVLVRKSPIHGRGVFARKLLRANTRVGTYDGEHVTENDTYVLWVEYADGEVVGIDGKNQLKYLNHSKQPNAEFWGDQLMTLRDIRPGEEITIDYGDDWL